MIKFQTFILALLLPFGASAMEWPSASWLWGSSDLLKVGKSHVSLSHQSRSADQRLNQNGRSENLGRSSRQFSERDGRSVVREFNIKINYERWSPTWAYGLSPSWTLMASLPLTRLRSNISESISQEDGGAVSATASDKALQNFKKGSGVQIAEAGQYNNLRVGRFELRSKHRVFETKKIAATLFETLKFPTLEKTQVDFVALTDPMPQSFGSGLGVLFNAKLSRRFEFILSSEYLYQFSDKVYGRKLDGLPTPEAIARKPGAEVISKMGAEYEPKKFVKLSAGYSYQGKAEDEYDDQGIQEADPSKKHVMYVGLAYLGGLKTARRLGQTGFSAAMGYEALLEGQNIENSDTLNVEVQMTF